MDSAYDAKSISQFVCGRGRIPIIDQNQRRKPSRAPFDEATKERYKKRSVRGSKKMSFELIYGVICLAAIKILEQFILPSLI